MYENNDYKRPWLWVGRVDQLSMPLIYKNYFYFVTVWESKNKALSSSASTVSFTSDELKRIRRNDRINSVNNISNCGSNNKRIPPEVLPKPKGHLFQHKFSVSSFSMAQSPEANGNNNSNVSSNNKRHSSSEHHHHQPIPIQSAKSTPSLNHILPLIREPGRNSENESPNVTVKPWKNSLDSLDNVSSVSSSNSNSPRYGDSNSNAVKSGSRSFHESSNSKKSTNPKRSGSNPTSTTDSQGGAAAAAANHSHSHSDSGLSSLSGRTSTMSPVSTLSTVSSVSSGSSRSNGSSRTSLRSASIVSAYNVNTGEETSSAPESLNKESDDVTTGARVKEVDRDSTGSSDSGTGTLRKGAHKKFREEIVCEELSREIFVSHLPNADNKLQSLFGEWEVAWNLYNFFRWL